MPPSTRSPGCVARPEIVLEPIPAPQRLAPYAFAVAARVAEPDADDDDLELASARFIVLYDPDGHESWDGTTRCVGYLSAGTDEELVDDAMFSEVAWSWLTDALDDAGAGHHNVGGTVTRTASTRFGDLAGPEHTVDVEMRASWTAEDHRPRPAPAGLARRRGQRRRPAPARRAAAGSLRPHRRRDSLTSVLPAGSRCPPQPAVPVIVLPCSVRRPRADANRMPAARPDGRHP